MLKHRIIPILMWDGNQAVQSVQFRHPHRKIGSMMQHIRVMETRSIDELIILDVEATRQKRGPLFKEIEHFTKELYCPVTIGGGITSLDDIGRLIQHCGADKVSICDAALDNPKLVEQAAHKYGSQAIVGVINAKNHKLEHFVYNGCYTDYTNFDPSSYAIELEKLGCGEILLTSIDNNGMFCGYDNNLIYNVSRSITINIVANGGCGSPAHMHDAINYGASAVAASSIFAFTETTPIDCAKYLIDVGIPSRLDILRSDH